MEQQFPTELINIADNMGLALYQRFTPIEASLFLRCPLSDILNLQKKGKIEYIQITKEQTEFFGYQLLNYLLNNIKGQSTSSTPPGSEQERILRIEEVVKLTGISRTTIWRKERIGEFPARVPLSSCIVGWRATEINEWIKNC